MDKNFIERMWRSLKYEDLYPKAYDSILEAQRLIDAYSDLYNQRQRHQALGERSEALGQLASFGSFLLVATAHEPLQREENNFRGRYSHRQ